MARPRIGDRVKVSLSEEDLMWIRRMAGALNESVPDTIRLIIKGSREKFNKVSPEDVEGLIKLIADDTGANQAASPTTPTEDTE